MPSFLPGCRNPVPGRASTGGGIRPCNWIPPSCEADAVPSFLPGCRNPVPGKASTGGGIHPCNWFPASCEEDAVPSFLPGCRNPVPGRASNSGGTHPCNQVPEKRKTVSGASSNSTHSTSVSRKTNGPNLTTSGDTRYAQPITRDNAGPSHKTLGRCVIHQGSQPANGATTAPKGCAAYDQHRPSTLAAASADITTPQPVD